MARYQVLKKSFINGRIHDPEEAKEPIYIEYEGQPGSNLKPMDDDARKAAAAAKEDQIVRLARLRAAGATENPNLFAAFMERVKKEIAGA